MVGRSSPRRIRVLISDATSLGCELLETALTRSGYGYVVVHRATSAEEISASLANGSAQVALISANLPGAPQSLYVVLDMLRTSYPATRPIVLFDGFDRSQIVEAFRRGARGVLLRSDPLTLLLRSIYQVHKGQIWAGSRELQSILEWLARATPRIALAPGGEKLLTQREQDVVDLVATGLSNRQISRQLGLSEHTVKNYLFRVFDKLGISSRTELMLYSLILKQD